jgi:ribosome-binding factor A
MDEAIKEKQEGESQNTKNVKKQDIRSQKDNKNDKKQHVNHTDSNIYVSESSYLHTITEQEIPKNYTYYLEYITRLEKIPSYDKYDHKYFIDYHVPKYLKHTNNLFLSFKIDASKLSDTEKKKIFTKVLYLYRYRCLDNFIEVLTGIETEAINDLINEIDKFINSVLVLMADYENTPDIDFKTDIKFKNMQDAVWSLDKLIESNNFEEVRKRQLGHVVVSTFKLLGIIQTNDYYKAVGLCNLLRFSGLGSCRIERPQKRKGLVRSLSENAEDMSKAVFSYFPTIFTNFFWPKKKTEIFLPEYFASTCGLHSSNEKYRNKTDIIDVIERSKIKNNKIVSDNLMFKPDSLPSILNKLKALRDIKEIENYDYDICKCKSLYIIGRLIYLYTKFLYKVQCMLYYINDSHNPVDRKLEKIVEVRKRLADSINNFNYLGSILNNSTSLSHDFKQFSLYTDCVLICNDVVKKICANSYFVVSTGMFNRLHSKSVYKLLKHICYRSIIEIIHVIWNLVFFN